MPELESWTLDEQVEDYFEKPDTADEPILDDLPGLEPLSDDSDDEDPGQDNFRDLWGRSVNPEEEVKNLIEQIQKVLTRCQPFPGDGRPVDSSYCPEDQRFIVERRERRFYCIYDRVQGFETDIHETRLNWWFFSIGKWFAERCAVNSGLYTPWNYSYQWMLARKWEKTIIGLKSEWPNTQAPGTTVELNGIQVDKNKYPTLQRNAAQVKGNQRILPKPIVVKVTVNGHPARALLDSGSLGDFMSSTLADQLGIKKTTLDVPLALQLAVQGSRSKVNTVVTAQLQYQSINESRTFDVINLNSYD
jgi:hypothetical protein